ncbi:MAG TPA: DUF4199 domain-containing protein [Flavobacterium sp.]|nr:DUF4199 domain-containing protein [Flavobacterium sp.]
MNEIIKKNGITYGVILGIFSILVTAVIYSVDVTLFMKPWVGLLSMAVFIIIGAMLVSKTKKQLNNTITFKEAFTVYFIAAVIASTMSVLFNIVLFNFVDPSLKATLQEMTIKYTVEVMQKLGTKASDINTIIADMQKTDNYSPAKQMLGLLFSFVFNAIFAAILALIFKTKSSHNE